MSAVTIDEKCGCGAAFQWRGDAAHSYSATREWRDGHCHPSPKVGICGDRAMPLVMVGGEIDQPWCELPAGHPGAHSSNDGRHWIKATRRCATPTSDGGDS